MRSATRFDLTSESAMESFQLVRANSLLHGNRFVVEVVPPKRSLDQNEMIHAIYKQVAEQKQDESFSEIRRECKLRHGIPIIRRDNEKFRAMYDKAMKGGLTYAEKLEAMEFLPVTSLMSKTQASEYIDSIIREYSMQGLCLLHPSELAA